MRVLIPEFGFEQSLRQQPVPALSVAARRALAEMAPLMALAGAGGHLLLATPSLLAGPPTAPGLPRVAVVGSLPELVRTCRTTGTVELVPWGWGRQSRSVADALHKAGVDVTGTIPSAPAVRTVAARSFSHTLEQETDTLPQGTARVESPGDLEVAFRQLPPGCDRWVIKAELGSSARERVVGHGREPDLRAVGWVRKALQRDGCVYLEPWLDRVREFGLQFDLLPGGDVNLAGCTELLCGADGRYLGSRFELFPEELPNDVCAGGQTLDMVREAAHRVAECGYTGPLGIDVLWYRTTSGHIAVRPLMDLNPRWTMGRLSLSLRRFLQPGEAGSWLHVVDEQAPHGGGEPAWSGRWISTSPESTAFGPVRRRTLAVFTRSVAEREQAEQRLTAGERKPPEPPGNEAESDHSGAGPQRGA